MCFKTTILYYRSEMELNLHSRSELGVQKYQEVRGKLSVALKQEEAERRRISYEMLTQI